MMMMVNMVMVIMMMMMMMMAMVIMMMMSWFTWRRRRRVRISETAIKAAVAPVFELFMFLLRHTSIMMLSELRYQSCIFIFQFFCCVVISRSVVRSMNSCFSVID